MAYNFKIGDMAKINVPNTTLNETLVKITNIRYDGRYCDIEFINYPETSFILTQCVWTGILLPSNSALVKEKLGIV